MLTPMICLALAAYMEARQHYATDPDALAAVVAVVQNRADDPRYPDDACAVISQPGQFPWPVSIPDLTSAVDQWAWDVALDVARDEIDGNGIGITSTHFHTAGKPQEWVDAFDLDGVYGGNVFYTNGTKWP